MPWIGPASRSCREDALAAPLPRFFAVAGFLAGRGADAVAAGFFLLTVFFVDFLPDFFADFLPLADFVDGLPAVFRRAAAFPVLFADFLLTFFVAFFPGDFFDADFFAAFFADFPDVAGFFRAVDFFFDGFFAGDFFAFTLRFLPAPFLLVADFQDAVVFLPVPARFCFLLAALAALFAAMFHSCWSEKNAELYIGCPNMEAYLNGIFPVLRTLFRPRNAAFRIRRRRFGPLRPGANRVRERSL
jgi:hypothetical protein